MVRRAWVGLYLALVVLVSLVPAEFHGSGRRFLWRLAGMVRSLDPLWAGRVTLRILWDFATNVLLYVPLGLLWPWMSRAPGWPGAQAFGSARQPAARDPPGDDARPHGVPPGRPRERPGPRLRLCPRLLADAAPGLVPLRLRRGEGRPLPRGTGGRPALGLRHRAGGAELPALRRHGLGGPHLVEGARKTARSRAASTCSSRRPGTGRESRPPC